MSARRAKVVYLAHTFMVGGAEEMALNLVRHLPDRFEPHVCCIHSAGPIGEEIRRAGVPFTVLGLEPGIRRPWDVLGIRAHLRTAAPQIVHTFLLTASLYGRPAAMLAGVPVIVGTEVNVYERKRRHHIAAERWLMRGTDHVVASAESVRDFYIEQVGADPGKVSVIYNAVDWTALETQTTRQAQRTSLQIPLDVPLACIIARLTEQKGHRVLFDAVARAPLGSLHLLVVGDGELRDDLEQRAAALGIASRVHFVGARRDLGALLLASDLFVMPSLWEGLPLAMVLALGAGMPVVATRVAGIPEVVRDAETGLLVRAGDVDALAEALARLLHDEALRGRLGRAAQAFVRPRFGTEGYVSAMTGLYDRLLAAKGVA